MKEVAPLPTNAAFSKNKIILKQKATVLTQCHLDINRFKSRVCSNTYPAFIVKTLDIRIKIFDS